MKIKKNKLRALIENYLNEDDWLGGEEEFDVNIKTNPEEKALSYTADDVAKAKKESARNLYDSVTGDIDTIKNSVKSYFLGKSYDKVLERDEVKSALKRENITKKQFLDDIIKALDKAKITYAKSIKGMNAAGLCEYPDSIDHEKDENAKILAKIWDNWEKTKESAFPYGARFKYTPKISVFLENVMDGLSDNFIKDLLEDKDSFMRKAKKEANRTLQHEYIHIGNNHMLDLLANVDKKTGKRGKSKLPFADELDSIFLKPADLFKDKERNKQSGVLDENGYLNEERRDFFKKIRSDYQKTDAGRIEWAARIQRLKIEGYLELAIKEYKANKITYDKAKSRYGSDVALLLVMIDYNKDLEKIIKTLEMYAKAKTTKKDSIPA